jgi:mannose-6-phosphate isomerase-like protein (cupin superfamily)
MKKITRRELCVALPAAAVLVSVKGRALVAQTASPAPSAPQAVPLVNATPAPGGGTMGDSRAIPFDQMPVHAMGNGGEGRSIAHGTLATGESLSLRQSMQPAGAAPLGLHAIRHTEFILVREGDLEFQHELGGEVVSEKVGAGGVIYIAFGTRHAIKNVGTVAARYFVVAVGGDTK